MIILRLKNKVKEIPYNNKENDLKYKSSNNLLRHARTDKECTGGGDISKEFSEQEKAPKEMLERAKKEGVIQKGSDETWRIVSLKKGTLWSAHYKSREKALSALRAYQKNKRGG